MMRDAIAWLRANPELAYLCFLLATGLVTEAFRKREPTEEADLRARLPRLVALRELARGLGFDGPKVRLALSVLLLGRYAPEPEPAPPRDPDGWRPPPPEPPEPAPTTERNPRP